MYATNMHEYGYMVNADDYTSSPIKSEVYEIVNNIEVNLNELIKVKKKEVLTLNLTSKQRTGKRAI